MKNLIILSGFLGSGKTSFLGELLAKLKHNRLAVLLNDFGEAPVDSSLLNVEDLKNSGAKDHLVELAGGSVFCACLKEHFVKALMELSQTDADVVIVETSGMSDPASMTSMMKLAGLDKAYTDPVIFGLFDPVKSLKLSHVLEVIPRQVRAADINVITKEDISSESSITEARQYILENNPDAPVLTHSTGSNKALQCLDSTGSLIDQRKVNREKQESYNTPGNRPESFTVYRAPSGIPKLIRALQNTPKVLRVKGFLPEGNEHFYISDTGRGFNVEKCQATEVPLTIICQKGAGDMIKNQLIKKDLIQIVK